MKAVDFLILAKTLAGTSMEAGWRSAVSRGYYATFHVARGLLESLGFSVPRGDQAHGYLWLRLGNCSIPQLEKAGRDLVALRRERNRADYDLHQSITQPIARAQVRSAEAIIEALDTATFEPIRSRIIDAMKTYERDVLKDITWRA